MEEKKEAGVTVDSLIELTGRGVAFLEANLGSLPRLGTAEVANAVGLDPDVLTALQVGMTPCFYKLFSLGVMLGILYERKTGGTRNAKPAPDPTLPVEVKVAN